jgi:hypothetical protein
VNKLSLSLAAAALLAAPLAARAEIGLRVGLDATVANHDSAGKTNIITDNWILGGDLMLSYWTPGSLLALDLELAQQFVLKAGGGDTRLGIVLRPGVRFSPPVLPFYLRAAIPFYVESPTGYGLRLGAGFTIPLVLFKVYIEGDADFPVGGNAAPSAFSNWAFLLNGGLDFRF